MSAGNTRRSIAVIAVLGVVGALTSVAAIVAADNGKRIGEAWVEGRAEGRFAEFNALREAKFEGREGKEERRARSLRPLNKWLTAPTDGTTSMTEWPSSRAKPSTASRPLCRRRRSGRDQSRNSGVRLVRSPRMSPGKRRNSSIPIRTCCRGRRRRSRAASLLWRPIRRAVPAAAGSGSQRPVVGCGGPPTPSRATWSGRRRQTICPPTRLVRSTTTPLATCCTPVRVSPTAPVTPRQDSASSSPATSVRTGQPYPAAPRWRPTARSGRSRSTAPTPTRSTSGPRWPDTDRRRSMAAGARLRMPGSRCLPVTRRRRALHTGGRSACENTAEPFTAERRRGFVPGWHHEAAVRPEPAPHAVRRHLRIRHLAGQPVSRQSTVEPGVPHHEPDGLRVGCR